MDRSPPKKCLQLRKETAFVECSTVLFPLASLAIASRKVEISFGYFAETKPKVSIYTCTIEDLVSMHASKQR